MLTLRRKFSVFISKHLLRNWVSSNHYWVVISEHFWGACSHSTFWGKDDRILMCICLKWGWKHYLGNLHWNSAFKWGLSNSKLQLSRNMLGFSTKSPLKSQGKKVTYWKSLETCITSFHGHWSFINLTCEKRSLELVTSYSWISLPKVSNCWKIKSPADGR